MLSWLPLEGGTPPGRPLASLRQFTLSCRRRRLMRWKIFVHLRRHLIRLATLATFSSRIRLFIFSSFHRSARRLQRSYLRRRGYRQQHQRRGHGAADPVNERRELVGEYDPRRGTRANEYREEHPAFFSTPILNITGRYIASMMSARQAVNSSANAASASNCVHPKRLSIKLCGSGDRTRRCNGSHTEHTTCRRLSPAQSTAASPQAHPTCSAHRMASAVTGSIAA